LKTLNTSIMFKGWVFWGGGSAFFWQKLVEAFSTSAFEILFFV